MTEESATWSPELNYLELSATVEALENDRIAAHAAADDISFLWPDYKEQLYKELKGILEVLKSMGDFQ